MKLNKPLRAVKAKPLSDKKQSNVSMDAVDNLAKEYMKDREMVEQYASALERTKERIKSLAESSGVPDGKSKLCFSRRYVVGYSESQPSPVVDEAEVRRLLKPATLRLVTKESIDLKELVSLVDQGTIAKKIFLKMLVPSDKKPTRRVYVETLESHKNKKERFSDEAA